MLQPIDGEIAYLKTQWRRWQLASDPYIPPVTQRERVTVVPTRTRITPTGIGRDTVN